MKKYIKDNDILVPDDVPIKVFTSEPVSENGFYFVVGRGLYFDGVPIIEQGQSGQEIIGKIKILYGSTIPLGWHLCDGSQFDETIYPDLYVALQYNNHYPDIRELTIAGHSGIENGPELVGDFGDDAVYHTHVKGGTGAHTHPTSGGSHSHSWSASGTSTAPSAPAGLSGTEYTVYTTNTTSSMAVNSVSGSASVTNHLMDLPASSNGVANNVDAVGSITRNVSVGVNYIIYQGI